MPPAESGGFLLIRKISKQGSLGAAACDQQLGPRLGVKSTDLHHGMIVRAVVNELSVADVHTRVRDLFWGRTKKKQVPSLQMLAFDSNNSSPRGLLIGITRQVDSASAQQHLGKSGTIETEARTPSPQVRNPEKAFRQCDRFRDRQQLGVRNDIAHLYPGASQVGQMHLEPAVWNRLSIFQLGVGNCFQSGFKGKREKRFMFGKVGFGINVREQTF